MNILLSGGGSPEKVVAIDKFFAEKVVNRKVLYVSLAIDKYTNEECEKWFFSIYSKYGINDFTTCTDLASCNLDNYGAVFIGGGNPFKLQKLVNESGFRGKLLDFANNDGFIYGVSAGAIILGNDIKVVSYSEENYVDLKEFDGLNLIDDYSIWCHYKSGRVEDEKEFLEQATEKLLLLYEESGVYYDGKTLMPIGTKYEEKIGK